MKSNTIAAKLNSESEQNITALSVNKSSSLPSSLKYKLYSEAVQSPADTVNILSNIYTDTFGARPVSLREDFCGTFLVGCEWVNSDPERRALGIDLATEPLAHARRNIKSKLKPDVRSRACVYQQDVRVPSIPRVDIITAENFSFYIFKKRLELVTYFRAAYSSLNTKGTFALDMIGGPGFVKTPAESTKTLKAEETGLPCPVVYRWRQRQFNAVTNEAHYHIDFKIKDHWYKDMFSYDWRIWSITEVSDALKEAGFNDVKIYWEEEESKGAVLRSVTEIGSDWETWSCVAVGIKSA